MLKILTSLALGLTVLASPAVRADDVVSEHKKALGKPEAIAKIKSIRRSGEVEFTGQFPAKGTIEEFAILGKKSGQKMKMDQFESTMVWNGEKGWVDRFGSTNEATAEEIGQMQGVAAINPFLGRTAELSPDKLVAGADADFGGVACKSYKTDDQMTLYIGKDDHLFHGMLVKMKDPSGAEVDIKVTYSDFKEHDGVKFADKVSTDIADGNMVITAKYTKTEINPTLADSLFEKP